MMQQQNQYGQVAMQYTNQPPVTVITQAAPQLPDKYQPSSLSQMKVLSSIQLAMGILAVIFGIVMLVIDSKNFYSSHIVVGIQGYGIWIGIYFMIVGGIGLGSARTNSNGWIVSAMILNIICSSFFCITLLSYASAGLVYTSINDCSKYFIGISYSFSNPLTRCDETLVRAYYALDSILLIMSIIEFVVTIWSAVLCCGAVCLCCKTSAMVQHQQVITTYPIAQQTGITVQQQHYPAGVHQAPMGGYVAQPQGAPYMMKQPQMMHQPQQGSSGNAVQSPPGYYEAPPGGHYEAPPGGHMQKV